jgi:hypothetical protein
MRERTNAETTIQQTREEETNCEALVPKRKEVTVLPLRLQEG